jgi:hypothetical protein
MHYIILKNYSNTSVKSGGKKTKTQLIQKFSGTQSKVETSKYEAEAFTWTNWYLALM